MLRNVIKSTVKCLFCCSHKFHAQLEEIGHCFMAACTANQDEFTAQEQAALCASHLTLLTAPSKRQTAFDSSLFSHKREQTLKMGSSCSKSIRGIPHNVFRVMIWEIVNTTWQSWKMSWVIVMTYYTDATGTGSHPDTACQCSV